MLLMMAVEPERVNACLGAETLLIDAAGLN